MLMIRLQRTGRKHEPTFRVVLTDSKNGPKSGKYLETLGWYDPRLQNKAKEQFQLDRVKHWMSHGAKLSLTLHNFLINEKVIEGKKLNALPRKTPIKKEEVKPAEAKKEETKPVEAPVEPEPSKTEEKEPAEADSAVSKPPTAESAA